MASDLTRITVNLIPAASEALAESAERDKLSQTDVVNRALQVYNFIDRQVRGGKAVLLRDGSGNVEQVHII